MNAMTGVDCQDRQAAAFIANAVGRRYSLRRLRVAHGEPRGNMFRQTLTAIAMIALTASAAGAAKHFQILTATFSIGGSTLDEIESELAKRGPRVRDSGRRHPGVTQMEFKSRIGLASRAGGAASCRPMLP